MTMDRISRVLAVALVAAPTIFATSLLSFHQTAPTGGHAAVVLERHGSLAPDVILASASTATSALQQTTRTVPIVFVTVIDPVGAGYVESLARPGATSPDSAYSNTGSAANGWSCSRRSRPG